MCSDPKEIFSSIEDLGRSTNRSIFLALGMFDGVHLGHQKVLAKVNQMAQESGLAMAFTFPKHPASYLRPESAPSLLMRKDEKADFLLNQGVSGVVLRTFDREFADVEAKYFPAFLIARIPSLAGLCVGENFRFGKGRIGDTQLLVEICKEVGLCVSVVKSETIDNEPISSSRIREALSVGRINEVNKMLGRKYKISARPVNGNKLGREIGFPTINVPWNPQAHPAFGVYTGRVWNIDENQKKFAIANYGMRPTVENNAQSPLLEIHLLDSISNEFELPEQIISMELENFVRVEKKFGSLDDLKNQIKKDLKVAGKYR